MLGGVGVYACMLIILYMHTIDLQDTCRGYNTDNLGNHLSYLSHIYSLVRSTKQHRRAFLKALLRYFEDYEVICM